MWSDGRSHRSEPNEIDQAINGDFMAGDQVFALPDTARCPVKPSLRSQPGAAALLFFAVGMLGTSGAS
jgi:hypothetical protein